MLIFLRFVNFMALHWCCRASMRFSGCFRSWFWGVGFDWVVHWAQWVIGRVWDRLTFWTRTIWNCWVWFCFRPLLCFGRVCNWFWVGSSRSFTCCCEIRWGMGWTGFGYCCWGDCWVWLCFWRGLWSRRLGDVRVIFRFLNWVFGRFAISWVGTWRGCSWVWSRCGFLYFMGKGWQRVYSEFYLCYLWWGWV